MVWSIGYTSDYIQMTFDVCADSRSGYLYIRYPDNTYPPKTEFRHPLANKFASLMSCTFSQVRVITVPKGIITVEERKYGR